MFHTSHTSVVFIQDTDLIVLDFAVNDGHVSPTWRDKDGYSFTSGARMGFEQLASGGMAACAEGGLRMSSENGTAVLLPACCLGVPIAGLLAGARLVLLPPTTLPRCPLGHFLSSALACLPSCPAGPQVAQAAGPAGAGAAAVLLLEQHTGQDPGEEVAAVRSCLPHC